MFQRTSSVSALLACTILTFLSSAIATELQVGKAQEGTLTNGKAVGYTLPLKAGDFVQANVDRRETELIITIYAPSGEKFRAFRIDPDYTSQIVFIAPDAGQYRLDVAGTEGSKSGSYSIVVTKIVPMQQRMSPPPVPQPESPRIKQLNADLNAGKPNALADFWQEVKTRTTPLIEPIEGDSQYALATFLWQGNSATQDVVVVWFPYVRGWPDDFRMVRLGETNVWYKTLRINRQERTVYRLAPNAGFLHASRNRDQEQITMLMAGSQTDPLNPRHWLHDPVKPDNPKYQDWSAYEMPDAPKQPWAEKRPGVPEGSVERQAFKSSLLNNERDLYVYLPAGYSAKNPQPYGLIVLFDGTAYVQGRFGPPLIPGSTTLDNLIAAKRIPPVVALLIDNPPGTRDDELACRTKFLEALNREMVPWVRENYNVTRDPHNTLVGGLSFGGLSAACAALYYPQTFGNVLAQSGGFAFTPPKDDNPLEFKNNPDEQPNWMAQQFIASQRLPVRFFLTAGTDEVDPSGRGQDILTSSRNLRDVLLAKGYEVHYEEFYGGHDFLSWRGSLADGLIDLLGNAKAEQTTAQKR